MMRPPCGGVVRHQIRIDEIPAAGLTYRVDQGYPPFVELLIEALEDGGEHRCQAEVTLRKEDQRVFLDGRLDAQLDLPCARCLERSSLDLRRDIHVVLVLERSDQDVEVELADDELDESYLDGELIDLPELIREQVLLAMPDKVVCSEDCRGLCAGCGADLNHEACQCSGKPMDPRMAALANLKIEEEQ